MKKNNLASNLFLLAGICYIFSGILLKDNTKFILGPVFITLGIIVRKKRPSTNNVEEVQSKDG